MGLREQGFQLSAPLFIVAAPPRLGRLELGHPLHRGLEGAVL